MDQVGITLQVPREFVADTVPGDGDEQPMVLLPRLMGRFPVTLAGVDVGMWTVTKVTQAMSRVALQGGPPGAYAEVPTYWVTTTRPVMP